MSTQALAHHEEMKTLPPINLQTVQEQSLDERLKQLGTDALGISKELMQHMLELGKYGIDEIQRELEKFQSPSEKQPKDLSV